MRALPALTPHPALGVDVDQTPNGLRRAAEARCSPEKDIVLVTTDLNQLDIAVNLLANLADVGVPHYLLITNDDKTCRTISDKLACVWTSLMTQFKPKLREAGTNAVRALWLMRQIYLGRLARMGFNPMLLDADVVLFRNPFPLVRAHLPGYQAIFLGDTSAGYMSANGGTVYVRGAARDGPVVQIWRNFERRVFELLNTSAKFPEQTFHKTRRGMVGGPGVPADALLYDQNVLDWSIVGQIVNDSNFVGRGFSSTMRYLTPAERAMIAWRIEAEVHRLPAGMSCPGQGFRPDFAVRSLEVSSGERREWLAKAPSWLFAAESDDYPAGSWLASRTSGKPRRTRIAAK